MKLVYITAKDTEKEYSGVYKKINNQIKSLKDNGIEVELYECDAIKKWKKLIPFNSRSFEWRKINIPKDTDVIYIRYQYSDFQFIQALRRWKKQNIRIIIEMPMYPYMGELKKMASKITIVRDLIYSRYISKYVSRIVTFTTHDYIYGVKTIPMVNGIDVNAIEVKKKTDDTIKSSINLFAVAMINFSHGYDRILAGLKEYYNEKGGKENIVFHLVGDGKILPELKKYVFENNLDEHVIFYGFKSATEVSELYDKMDIGIDVLGGHRKGDWWFGTLKSREYLCKGLPFITEYELPDNVKPMSKYILNVPADETPINMEDVVKFYSSIRNLDAINDMRNFAKEYCDINVVMLPLVNYINEGL